MTEPREDVVHGCIQELRSGDAENAFFTLVETGPDHIPAIIAATRDEKDVGVREMLVEVLWQKRSPTVLSFLGELLFDVEPRIWKAALDGLVANASGEAILLMRAAESRTFADARHRTEFEGWLREAIAQAEAEIAEG